MLNNRNEVKAVQINDIDLLKMFERLKENQIDSPENRTVLTKFFEHAPAILVALIDLNNNHLLNEKNRLRICAFPEFAKELAVAIFILHRSGIDTISNWQRITSQPNKANTIAAGFECLVGSNILTDKNKEMLCDVYTKLESEASRIFGNALCYVSSDGNLTEANFHKLCKDPQNAFSIGDVLKKDKKESDESAINFTFIPSESTENPYEILELNGYESKKTIHEKYKQLIKQFKNDEIRLNKVIQAKRLIDQSKLFLELVVEDPYELFKLDKESSVSVSKIDKQFRNISKIYHPDKYSNLSLCERFRLNAQFQKLVSIRDQLIKNALINLKYWKPAASPKDVKSTTEERKTPMADYSFFNNISRDHSKSDVSKERPSRKFVPPVDSYYALLGVEIDASYLDIQRAWADKTLKFRDSPEKFSSDFADKINKAFQILGDKKWREDYDRQIGKPIPWGGQFGSFKYDRGLFFTAVGDHLYEKFNSDIRENTLSYQDEITTLNKNSKNKLLKAIANKNSLTDIEILLKQMSKDEINETDESSYKHTAAHLAIIVYRRDHKNGDLLKLLAKYGCDLQKTTTNNATLCDLAIFMSRPDVWDSLEELNVTVDDWQQRNDSMVYR